jgi:hypothetical protein
MSFGFHRLAGSWRGSQPYTRPGRRILVPPIRAYGQVLRVPIQNQGVASTTAAADGTATISVGPQGIGTSWYPQSAAIATATGPIDNSYVRFYRDTISQATLLYGHAFHGGGDTAGLDGVRRTPGDLIIAVWTGAQPGDLCTLTVKGEMDVLNPAWTG